MRGRGVLLAMLAACSDSDPTPAPTLAKADPGGTFGATVTVNVVGHGKVVSADNAIDCPTFACFGSTTFASPTDGGITLAALPSDGEFFQGWSFDPSPVGGRGRGPDACNPLVRPASTREDANNESITLLYGETTGTPPAGHDAECAAYTKLPLAYQITATFSSDVLPPTSVPPGGAFPGAAAFVSLGSLPSGLIATIDGNLYWEFVSSTSGSTRHGVQVAYAAESGSSFTQAVIDADDNVDVYSPSAYGIALQMNNGQVRAITPRSPTESMLVDVSPPSCANFAVDLASNVFCTTVDSTLVEWPILPTGYYGQSKLHGSGISGPIVVENDYVYYATTTAIRRVSLDSSDSIDAGSVSTELVAKANNPHQLISNGTRLAWLEGNSLTTCDLDSNATPIAGPTLLGSGFYIAPDPLDPMQYWVTDPYDLMLVRSGSSTISTFGHEGGYSSITALGSLPYYTRGTSFIQQLGSRSGVPRRLID